MSFPPPVRFTDLPQDLHVRIINMLIEPQYHPHLSLHPPFQLSLHAATNLRTTLPNQLLPLALTSPLLADAVAAAMGPPATFLTANNAGAHHLPTWIHALAPHVTAVSAWDWQAAYVDSMGEMPTFPHVSMHTRCENARRLIEALAIEAIPLKVLGIADAPLHRFSGTSASVATAHLVRTLSACASSLTQLAVPVSSVSAFALSMIELPHLHTLELHMRAILEYVDAFKMGCVSHLCSFSDMFLAFRCHERPPFATSSIRELKMLDVVEAPFQSHSHPHFASALCTSVTSLYIRNSCTIQDMAPGEDDRIANFISLFSNLRRLRWNGDITAGQLHIILNGCLLLDNITLEPPYRYEEITSEEPYDHIRDIALLPRILAASRGKLCSLSLEAHLTKQQWTMLGKNCPALESITTEISADNVHALIDFLGIHCRKLRALVLSFIPDTEISLGARGWKGFATAISAASHELKEVSLESDNEHLPLEYDMKEMSICMASVFQSLGTRAEIVRFQVPMATSAYMIMLSSLCHLLQAAARYCCNMKHLILSLRAGDVDSTWGNDTHMAPHMWKTVLNSRMLLRTNCPNLQTLYVDGWDQEAEEFFQDLAASNSRD